MPLSQAVRNGHDIVVAFDVNQIDSEKIAGYVTALDEVHEADSEVAPRYTDTLGELVSRKGLPITDRVRMLGDAARRPTRRCAASAARPRSLRRRQKPKTFR